MPDIKCEHFRKPPRRRPSGRKMWTYTAPPRPLWWDDASYIRYQSGWDAEMAHDEHEAREFQRRLLATIYTGDYCRSEYRHAEHCPQYVVPTTWDDPPF